MRARIEVFGLMLFLLATVSEAQQADVTRPSAEIALSDDTLQLKYIATGTTVGVDRNSRFTGAFFLSEDRDIVLDGGLLFPAELGIDRLSVHVGPRVYVALLDEENGDVLAATVGAEVRFLLNRSLGLAVAGHAFYGPDILTFGSADNLTDLGARVEVGMADQVIAFAGMRWFEFDLTDGGAQTLMEEVFVGFGYRF
jgi:hypothetical protein